MTRDLLVFLFTPVAIGLLNACPQSPVAPPPPDATDAIAPPVAVDASIASCQTACAAMARVGCTVLSDCSKIMCMANADPRFKHHDVACLSHALVPSDVRNCGTDCIVKP